MKIDLGFWNSGTINDKLKIWAKKKKYKSFLDSKKYINVLVKNKVYVISDVYQKINGHLMVILKEKVVK